MAQESAQTYTESVLYTFTDLQDGAKPAGDLLQDAQGNLYGATSAGGDPICNCGTVFKLDTTGKETVLHAFIGSPDGQTPTGGLVEDVQGNLYGTTFYGGAHSFGTVFKLDTSGTETLLYSFTGGDGRWPNGGLLRDSQGNLYGTTFSGGDPVCYCGVVFKLDTTGKLTVLHSFTGTDGFDGISPAAGLVRDSQGNLFGTTAYGGLYDLGGVFELDSGGNEGMIQAFTSSQDPHGLVRDSQGNLYGTTALGFFSPPAGQVFKVPGTGGEYIVLYTFTGGADGGEPYSDLVRDAQGNLYGTTVSGGTNGAGTVFRLDTSSNETVLHSFTGGADGGQPFAGLLRDARGNLYGTTQAGGDPVCKCGTVFKLTASRR
jgi:uncharacterized repeat protein (TIGR03803 family)